MEKNPTIEQARQVKARHEKALMKLANVVGVGIGLKERDNKVTDQLAIIVNVKEKKALSDLIPEDVVPSELDGVAVDVQEVGQIRAF